MGSRRTVALPLKAARASRASRTSLAMGLEATPLRNRAPAEISATRKHQVIQVQGASASKPMASHRGRNSAGDLARNATRAHKPMASHRGRNSARDLARNVTRTHKPMASHPAGKISAQQRPKRRKANDRITQRRPKANLTAIHRATSRKPRVKQRTSVRPPPKEPAQPPATRHPKQPSQAGSRVNKLRAYSMRWTVSCSSCPPDTQPRIKKTRHERIGDSMRRTIHLSALLAVCACWLSATASAQNAAVTVHLQPDTIAADQAATLMVTTDGTVEPELPQLAGLQIEPVGTQTSMTVTNGVATQTATYLYSVQAQRPGEYDIAGIKAGNARAETLRLHVQDAGVQQPSAAATEAPVASPQEGKLAFMRLRVDERRIYTSQSVPFTVKAYFRGGTGVSVRGRPQLSSDAFTVSGLDDEPTQQQTTIDGVPYLAVTWRGSLTAAKAGDFPLDMTLPVTMQYREQAQPEPGQQRTRGRTLRDLFGGQLPFGGGSVFGQGSPFDRLFDDSFFDSMLDEPMLQGFGEPGRMVQRDLDLHGRAGTAHVAALPSTGRPADFSGAVGQFELEARLPQPTLVQGEPVDLEVTVQGTGNFGQFSLPPWKGSSAWKTYSGHSSFAAADKAGLQGKLTLQQPVAALQVGPASLPALRFSYFDPKEARYVTRQTAPITVDITPAQGQASSAPVDVTRGVPAANSGSERAPLHEPSVRSLASGGVPAWLLPCAGALLCASFIACAAVGLRRSQRYQERSRRSQHRRALSRQLDAMQHAQRTGDRLAYLRAGRAALQRKLAARWGMSPESISVRELDARWPDAPASLRQLLERADEADYGRTSQTNAAPDFAIWAHDVDQQLSRMEVRS